MAQTGWNVPPETSYGTNILQGTDPTKTGGGMQDPFTWIFGADPTMWYTPPGRIPQWTPEQTAALQALTGYLTPTVGQPGAQYGGQMVAGVSPYQESFLNKLLAYESPTGKSLQKQYMAGPGAAMTRTWREDVIPELRGEFGRKGLFYGSGRGEAETESAGRLMEALSTGATGYELGARQVSLQEILGLTGAGMQYGDIYREVEQAELSAEYSEWLRTQPGATPEMAMLMQILGLDPYAEYGPQMATAGGEGGQGGVLSSIIGALI